MARTIDLEERRRVISEAAHRVLARDGLAALSVRNVATEAGLPPSTVRYAFPTQASVREHAIALVFDRTRERITAIPDDLPAREQARAVLIELLPLDEERVVELDVYLALGNAALTDRELRPTLDRVVAETRAWCEHVLEVLGVPAAELDAEVARLHALVDGLAVHVARLAPAASADWAIAVLERHVAPLGTVR